MSDRDRLFDLEEYFEKLHKEINQAKALGNIAFLVRLDAYIVNAADSVRLGINIIKSRANN